MGKNSNFQNKIPKKSILRKAKFKNNIVSMHFLRFRDAFLQFNLLSHGLYLNKVQQRVL